MFYTCVTVMFMGFYVCYYLTKCKRPCIHASPSSQLALVRLYLQSFLVLSNLYQYVHLTDYYSKLFSHKHFIYYAYTVRKWFQHLLHSATSLISPSSLKMLIVGFRKLRSFLKPENIFIHGVHSLSVTIFHLWYAFRELFNIIPLNIVQCSIT